MIKLELQPELLNEGSLRCEVFNYALPEYICFLGGLLCEPVACHSTSEPGVWLLLPPVTSRPRCAVSLSLKAFCCATQRQLAPGGCVPAPNHACIHHKMHRQTPQQLVQHLVTRQNLAPICCHLLPAASRGAHHTAARVSKVPVQ